MAGTDAVAAHSFQNLQPALPKALGHGGAHTTAVMVQADAVDLYLLAVEQESKRCIEANLAYTERRFINIRHFVACVQGVPDPVEIGFSSDHRCGCETWMDCVASCSLARSHRVADNMGCHHLTLGVQNFCQQLAGAFPLPGIADASAHRYHGGGF